MPKRKPVIEVEDGEVELVPKQKKKLHLFVQRGFGLRPRVGGGRVPVLFCATAESSGWAKELIEVEQGEVTARREWQFEAMAETQDWGESAHPAGASFFVGHGVSMWEKKHLEKQLSRP